MIYLRSNPEYMHCPGILFTLSLPLLLLCSSCGDRVYDLSGYGIRPDSGENSSPLIARALEKIAEDAGGKPAVVLLPEGRYDFYPEGAAVREYYISNHDQDNPKYTGIPMDSLQNIVFDGQGSELVFHGRMLPVSLTGSSDCTLRNFSIDFENPHISQVRILENDTENGTVTYELAPWVEYEIRNGRLVVKGEGWEHVPAWGIAFEGSTRHVLYNTGDISVGVDSVEEISPRVIRAPWRNGRLVPGTVVVMRSWGRPAPGIFMYHDRNTVLENIRVHYAEGMGLLAQMCENVTLKGFSVCLRGDDDPRYFTTQADATHFSGCKGMISSTGGLYEGMMDDAINVHGTYLKVLGKAGDRALLAGYMHPQSYGFEWGCPGDTVQFIDSETMELLSGVNVVESIRPSDSPDVNGAKQFIITFREPLDSLLLDGSGSYGIENLEWTPEVCFAGNTVRDNRARGSLFSTPRRTVVENNDFYHTSGSAVLLCGDCNGWFETGACREVIIRGNRFTDALTSMYQFTWAVISICPEIPDLERQEQYFHRNIVIEDNVFDVFDAPLVYAKSVDGLVFRHNTVRRNDDYPPFHPNRYMFNFQRVKDFVIDDNDFEGGFVRSRDLLSE